MSVSVDDTGAQLPGDNEPEIRATDAVRELKRGASCKDVLATLWPSDAVDEASLEAFARILRNDAILARCPPKPSYLRQVLAKAVSQATDAGYSDDALCEELAQAVVRDDDDEDAASHVALGSVVMRTVDRANEVGLRLWPAAEVLVEWALSTLSPSRVLELGAGLGLVGLALARRPGFQVTLTDGDARVCANLRYNAALNDLGEDVVRQFRWEDGLWEEPFDVVLAADCLYDPLLVPPFAAVVDQAVARGADVVLANAVRNPETWRVVVEALAARGLAFEDLACVQVPRLVPARAWAGHAAALASGGLRLGRVVRRV
jgi:predicted nicotinamide N-methyase